MTVLIQIPTPLRGFADEQAEVAVAAATVGEAMEQLVTRYEGLRPHLFGDDGKLRTFVNLFLNDEDVRYLEREATPINGDATLAIIPSIAGGTVAEPPPAAAQSTAKQSTATELNPEEILRYSRHLIMPEVGSEGQLKLKQAKVLMIGTGGLGSPVGMYLAAAGVGRLGLVDFDVVDESNLHRQLLYSNTDVGRPKLDAAVERLHEVNPHIELTPHPVLLDSSNALEIFEDYDVIVDGTDNFPTRYLVNDACVLLGKPNVYGSIFRFEGQVSVFWGAKGPCYRCLFAEPPPPGLVPSCAEGGVLGVLPGIIGSLQANEVIKLIIGQGDPLIGRLLLFDALRMSFRELKLRKNPDCPICSENPTQTELIDYEQFCGVPAVAEEPALNDLIDVTPSQVQSWMNDGRDFSILDVRGPQEYAICRIDGSTLIPVAELESRIDELDPSKLWVVHCHHGPRSTRATNILRDNGFPQAYNLAGGIDAWAVEVDPSLPRY
ncbi:MAG: molybdopterin-synthase adenylyltransferase MoeB [Acidobacteria bacterium]|nr:molybdopterin-synthase adenylyltransferase MoeB [Acidobacteriota bacterium]